MSAPHTPHPLSCHAGMWSVNMINLQDYSNSSKFQWGVQQLLSSLKRRNTTYLSTQEIQNCWIIHSSWVSYHPFKGTPPPHHLWMWFVARAGPEGRRGGREACVQKQSLVFSDSASLIANNLRWRRCEEPLSWSWRLTRRWKQEGLKWQVRSYRDGICSRKMLAMVPHRLKGFVLIFPGGKWGWISNFSLIVPASDRWHHIFFPGCILIPAGWESFTDNPNVHERRRHVQSRRVSQLENTHLI